MRCRLERTGTCSDFVWSHVNLEKSSLSHPQIKKEKNKPEKLKEKVKLKEKMKPKGKKLAASAKAPQKVDKNLLAQRRQEERQRQQMILEEMKKPTEDMCLRDHLVCRVAELHRFLFQSSVIKELI